MHIYMHIYMYMYMYMYIYIYMYMLRTFCSSSSFLAPICSRFQESSSSLRFNVRISIGSFQVFSSSSSMPAFGAPCTLMTNSSMACA